jgi:hypothetical protein
MERLEYYKASGMFNLSRYTDGCYCGDGMPFLSPIFHYIEKRWAEYLDLSRAKDEFYQVQQFVDDSQRTKKWKVVQFKCQFAECYIRDRSSRVPEIAEQADTNLEHVIQSAISAAYSVEDEYCKSAILHSVVDLMCKAGYFERAANLMKLITIETIKTQAIQKMQVLCSDGASGNNNN